jgi:hypothetical protein
MANSANQHVMQLSESSCHGAQWPVVPTSRNRFLQLDKAQGQADIHSTWVWFFMSAMFESPTHFAMHTLKFLDMFFRCNLVQSR